MRTTPKHTHNNITRTQTPRHCAAAPGHEHERAPAHDTTSARARAGGNRITRETLVSQVDADRLEMKSVYNYIESIQRPQPAQGINVLYLCGGIGMFAQALKEGGVRVANHIDVELDERSRNIASANHKIDHGTLPQDLWQVTDAHLQGLARKYGRIHLVIATTPCQGLSSANASGTGLQDPRSSLFYKAIEVIQALRRADTDVKYIAENVDFRKNHPLDYQEICRELGPAEYIDAAHTSGANRKRLFWHNLGSGGDQQQRPRMNANTLLEGGARLPAGATTAPCLMASWHCKHADCKHLGRGAGEQCTDPHNHAEWQAMNTYNPVTVVQRGHRRHITPTEGERLMGLPDGYTARERAAGGDEPVAGIHRLTRLGGGIDVRSVQTLVARLLPTAAAGVAAGPESTNVHVGDLQEEVAPHVKAHAGWNVKEIARWLTPGLLPGGGDDATWQHTWLMRGASELIKGCTQGFPLRYEGDRERDVEHANGRTCQQHPEITAEELKKEVSAGRIAGPYATPPLPGFKTVPRGLKEEPTKYRPITMGNMPFGDSVNDGIPKLDNIQLARAQDIERKINAAYRRTGQVWMAKADVKMAYRTVPVDPADWHLQGIKWAGQYYIDMRMSFGCRSSVDKWLGFADALAWALLRWGVHALHYVDDFIFIAGSEEECKEQLRKFKHICAAWGVDLKDQEDCGPAQQLTALGVHYDLVAMKRKITPQRVAGLRDMLREATTSRKRDLWERITGVLWYVIKCVPIGTPHLQPIMEATLRARRQHKPVIPNETSTTAVRWWQQFLAEIGQHDGNPWHGESIIPTAHAVATTAMGDAGSEWGMGGHDDHSYFKAPWTPEQWDAVQREKSTSSLHMEAMQLLVMTRVMAETWAHKRVIVELDSLGLTQACRRGRHKHPGINAILRDVAMAQIRHDFTMETRWVRRCHNEAADALSKNDMDRFWGNIKGDRTQIILTAEHTKLPAHSKTGGMRRTARQREKWDERPVTRVAPPISAGRGTTTEQINRQIAAITAAHEDHSEPLHGTRTGAKHYLRFCERTGRANNVAPPYKEMVQHTLAWLADAVHTYRDPTTGKVKKAISTTSITTYMTHIDHWYAIVTDTPRGLLQKNDQVKRHRRLITAKYTSARRQVHGVTCEKLGDIMTAAREIKGRPGRILRAAYTLAWFALLRPTEYMLTPLHGVFDPARHLRAGDVTFWKGGQHITHTHDGSPDRMIVNVKQSKTDFQRLGAKLVVGSTGKRDCPVANAWHYVQADKPPAEGPLFPGLTYATMLKVTRTLIGQDAELYGMHSFRVGGAQAMALAGRSAAYIMGRGRWKHMESVSRYVEAPEDTKAADSKAMAMTEKERAATERTGWGREHTQPERERLLPHPTR